MPTVIPRYFYPWDPLQLSQDVDLGLRVEKASVILPLFRTRRRPLLWTPFTSPSCAVFYETREHGEAVLEAIAQALRRAEGFSHGCTLELYTLDPSWAPCFQGLESQVPWVHARPYEGTLRDLLEALLAHQAVLLEKTRALGFTETPDKPLHIVGIPLDTQAVAELATEEVEALLLQVMAQASATRTHPLLLTENSFQMPPRVLQELPLGCYLGDENEVHLRQEVAPGQPLGPHSFHEMYLGVARDTLEANLIPLHPLKKTLSSWALARAEQKNQEAELYREFLASLNDGTEL